VGPALRDEDRGRHRLLGSADIAESLGRSRSASRYLADQVQLVPYRLDGGAGDLPQTERAIALHWLAEWLGVADPCVPPAVAGAAGAAGAGAVGLAIAAGSWRTAIEVPGSGALNAGGLAGVSSVSCASAGNCSAGGSYKGRSGAFQAFVASEGNGRWG